MGAPGALLLAGCSVQDLVAPAAPTPTPRATVDPVLVSRDVNGTHHVCTHVEIAAPTEVDGTRRTYDVALDLNATRGFPAAPVDFP